MDPEIYEKIWFKNKKALSEPLPKIVSDFYLQLSLLFQTFPHPALRGHLVQLLGGTQHFAGAVRVSTRSTLLGHQLPKSLSRSTTTSCAGAGGRGGTASSCPPHVSSTSPQHPSGRAGLAVPQRQPQGFTCAVPSPRDGGDPAGPRAGGNGSGSCGARESECMYGAAFREQIQVGQFTL